MTIRYTQQYMAKTQVILSVCNFIEFEQETTKLDYEWRTRTYMYHKRFEDKYILKCTYHYDMEVSKKSLIDQFKKEIEKDI